MRCRECEAVLWSYVDRELTLADRRAVEAHIVACARCAGALERVRAFPLNAIELRCAAPPPDFTERLMRRIEPLPTPRDYALQARASGMPHQLPALALAFTAAAAAVLLGLFSTSLFALLVRDASRRKGTLDLPSVASIGLADATLVWHWVAVNAGAIGSALVVIALMVGVFALLWRHLLDAEPNGGRH